MEREESDGERGGDGEREVMEREGVMERGCDGERGR